MYGFRSCILLEHVLTSNNKTCSNVHVQMFMFKCSCSNVHVQMFMFMFMFMYMFRSKFNIISTVHAPRLQGMYACMPFTPRRTGSGSSLSDYAGLIHWIRILFPCQTITYIAPCNFILLFIFNKSFREKWFCAFIIMNRE